MHAVVARTRRSEDGREVHDWDPAGGVFLPAEGASYPVFYFGTNSREQEPVFTCPVSAIPAAVWTLLDLFLAARSMGLPVRAGGLEAQPYVVRRSFPILEAEISALERNNARITGVAAVAQLFGGGGAVPTRPSAVGRRR